MAGPLCLHYCPSPAEGGYEAQCRNHREGIPVGDLEAVSWLSEARSWGCTSISDMGDNAPSS